MLWPYSFQVLPEAVIPGGIQWPYVGKPVVWCGVVDLVMAHVPALQIETCTATATKAVS